MKAVELFAGIGGFRIAAENAGVQTIWANDNSAMACSVYRDRFGDKEIREGDVETFVSDIPAHDLLTGGFPCQPFSAAGKKMGIEDPRGTLFETIVNVLQARRPKYFVLENVKRLLTMDYGSHFATILDALAKLDYAIEWRLLNAMDFGLAQNRQRVFITGKLRVSGEAVKCRLVCSEELEGGSSITAGQLSDPESWTSIMKHDSRFPSWGVAADGRFFGLDPAEFQAAAKPVLLKDVLQPWKDVNSEFDFTDSTVQRFQSSTIVNKYIGGVEVLSNQGGGARMGYTVFGASGVAPTLTASTSRHYERYRIGDRYRRLTNIEYARLQGFPDDHCSAVTVYHQYALFGNAVPPCMAEWAIRRVLSPGTSIAAVKRRRHQSDLFADV